MMKGIIVKELPLISLLGYALEHDDVIRMSNNAEEELQEIRKELGYSEKDDLTH